MYHHDSRDYNVAVSEAAAGFRAKFEGWKDEGKRDAMAFFQRLEDEHPWDKIVNTGDLDFDIRGGRIYVNDKADEWLLHRNAVNQMVAKTGILTGAVADKMIDAVRDLGDGQEDRWGRELLLHNLRTIFHKSDRDRVLLRAVKLGEVPEARGFLSDKYRRMSCGPILTTFAQTAMSEFGAVPMHIRDGKRNFNANYYHDTKVGFSMFLDNVFEPVNGEVLAIGLMVQNSDFGSAALTVRLVMIRIWCTNLAITQDELRKVHLGTRLSEDIQFSEETYRKDTETMASAIKDIVRTLLGADRINAYVDRIRRAAEQKVEDPRKLFEALRGQGHLLKAEATEIGKLFNEPEIEMMPAGQSIWRASNAISLFANKLEDEGKKERAVELRHAAGIVLDKYVEDAQAA